MAYHEPIVTARTDYRITEAKCSCGANLELGQDSGSSKKQAESLGAAFQKHKKERAATRKKPAAPPKLTLVKKGSYMFAPGRRTN